MRPFSTATPENFRPTCFYHSGSAAQRVDIAVSACLAGEKVRYDGAAKSLPLYSLLQTQLNLIHICPEIGAGLGVPRPPVQLIEADDQIHALGRENRLIDVTNALQNFAEQSLQRLQRDHLLCGYVWKSRSPSCGFGSTPLFNRGGDEIDMRYGIQADYFRRHLPHLNYCEETALQTPHDVARFVLRSRLVFDVLHAANTSLAALHRHYRFLHERFDEPIRATLESLSHSDEKNDYVTALLNGCSHEDNLLELFR